MRDFIAQLQANDEIKIISDEVDVYLEIAHIAYIEIKKPNAKPLLFLNPVDKKRGIKYDIPVLINLFANFDMVKRIVGDVEALASGDRAIDKALSPYGLYG